MTTIPFYKMSGSGNDFILIDNREAIVPSEKLPQLVAKVCRRSMSVGADGFILIENAPGVDFKWQFFNSDGSAAEMCGNGARCAARFAHLAGIAGPRMVFETVAGNIEAAVGDDGVRIKMTDPEQFVLEELLELSNGTLTCSHINTGVPHVVVEVDDIEKVDVKELGREIRFHSRFQPAGTNANFVASVSDTLWAIRTYERGVEDETLACGTGNVAAALVLAANHGIPSPVTLHTRSGSRLKIYFSENNDGFYDIFLEGDARVIYQGELWAEAWQY